MDIYVPLIAGGPGNITIRGSDEEIGLDTERLSVGLGQKIMRLLGINNETIDELNKISDEMKENVDNTRELTAGGRTGKYEEIVIASEKTPSTSSESEPSTSSERKPSTSSQDGVTVTLC